MAARREIAAPAASPPRQEAHGLRQTLTHHVAGIVGKLNQVAGNFQGLQAAERGNYDGTDVFVRIVQMTNQACNRGRAHGCQDFWNTIAMLLGQALNRAERHQQRADGHGAILRQGVAGTFMNRFVRTPEIGDRLCKKLALAHGGEDLLQQHKREAASAQHRGRGRSILMNVRDIQMVGVVGEIETSRRPTD